MRMNFIKTVLVAAAAMAFASCTKDNTTDLAPSRQLSGITKGITINASFESVTRTALEGHELTWVEGDTFGVLAADASGILANIESSEYAGGDSYAIEIPEEATSIYCYYPYSSAYDNLTDIADFTIEIPSTYTDNSLFADSGYYASDYAGEFLPQYHFMAADAVAVADEVEVTFTPLVSILEFNIYDTTESGEKLNALYFSAGGKINGTFTVDFAAKTLTADSAEDGLTYAFTDGHALSPGSSSDNGAKIYAVVPKGEYTGSTLTVGSVSHEFNPSNGYFNNLEWTEGTSFTADGHTINIDLKHALPAPLAEPKDFIQVEGNPYFITVPVTVQPGCDFFAIAVIPTTAYEREKAIRNDSEENIDGPNYGKNSYDIAVATLYDAYITEWINNSNEAKVNNYLYGQLQWYPFQGYYDESIEDQPADAPRTLTIDEDWQLLYNGRWNSETHKFDLPSHTSLTPGTDYTFVAYAKAAPAYTDKYSDDFVVYETKFRTSDAVFNGTGTLNITDYEQTGGKAAAKLSGSNIRKVAMWTVKSLTDGSFQADYVTSGDDGYSITPANLKSVLTLSDVYFIDYTEDLTFELTGMNPGDKCIFCAAGVDEDGKLVAATPVLATAEDIEFSGYAVTKAEIDGLPTAPREGYTNTEIKMTFTVDNDTKYLRIYTGAPRNIDGVAADTESGQTEQEALPWIQIQANFKNNTSTANYQEVAVENGQATATLSLPGDAMDSIDSSGDNDVEIPATGNNPFYILVVGADASGAEVSRLGDIYQIYSESKENWNTLNVYKCEDDIKRGVEVGDKTHTVKDTSAYFYSCPADQWQEAEEEQGPTGLWTDGSMTFSFANNDVSLWVYATASSGKGWIIKLNTNNSLSYAEAQSEFAKTGMSTINKIFASYDDSGEPTIESGAELIHKFDTFPTNSTAGTIEVASTDWLKTMFDSMQKGDVFAVVFENGNESGPLSGKLYYADTDNNFKTYNMKAVLSLVE